MWRPGSLVTEAHESLQLERDKCWHRGTGAQGLRAGSVVQRLRAQDMKSAWLGSNPTSAISYMQSLGKSFNFPRLSFPISKMGMMMVCTPKMVDGPRTLLEDLVLSPDTALSDLGRCPFLPSL